MEVEEEWKVGKGVSELLDELDSLLDLCGHNTAPAPPGLDSCKEITLLVTVAMNAYVYVFLRLILSVDDLKNNQASRASQSAALLETG